MKQYLKEICVRYYIYIPSYFCLLFDTIDTLGEMIFIQMIDSNVTI